MGEPKELERRLAEAEERADDAEKELIGFAYAVSHDLRGPLRSIMSGAMVLEEDHGDRLGAGGAEEIARIRRSAKAMSALLDDLLKYSRLSRQALNIEPVDVSAIASLAATGLQHRNDGLEVEVASGIVLQGDAELLRLIVEQLLDNAVKFGGHHISLEPIEAGFSVRDDGRGFSAEQAERIFLPFEKLNGDELPGSGMGLALVNRGAARLGARVTAEAEPGAGARFTFTIKG